MAPRDAAKISALDLRMAEEDLHGAQIASLLVLDLRLGPMGRMRPVLLRRSPIRVSYRRRAGRTEEAELCQMVGASGATAKESILFGGGPALCDSAGVPWTAAYVDSRGEPKLRHVGRPLGDHHAELCQMTTQGVDGLGSLAN